SHTRTQVQAANIATPIPSVEQLAEFGRQGQPPDREAVILVGHQRSGPPVRKIPAYCAPIIIARAQQRIVIDEPDVADTATVSGQGPKLLTPTFVGEESPLPIAQIRRSRFWNMGA